MSSESSAEVVFGKEVGLLAEVMVTGRKVGADKAFWASLAHSEELFSEVVGFVTALYTNRKLVVPIIDYMAKMVAPTFNIRSYLVEKPIGATCKKPMFARDGEAFEPFLREISAGGEALLKRAEEMDIRTGFLHAQAIFHESWKIPGTWRKHRNLIFPEVWETPTGKRCMPFLSWNGVEWCKPALFKFDGIIEPGSRLVDIRKPA